MNKEEPKIGRIDRTIRGVRVIRGELIESFLMALDALGTHKLRSSLTVLGVLVGVFSILLVMTAMRVLQGDVQRELSQFGGQTFVIQKFPPIHFWGGDRSEYLRREDITLEQVDELVERAVLPLSIGGDTSLTSGVEFTSRYGKTAPTIRMRGATPGSLLARNLTVGEGRGFVASDLEGARMVCLLGNSVAMTLFPFGSAVHEEVSLGGARYTVVGVLEAKGAMRGDDDDNSVLIPITTGLNRYGKRNRSLTVYVQARSVEMFSETMEEVRGIMRTTRKVSPGAEDDFEIFSSDAMNQQFEQILAVVRIGVGGISSIALLAAGVGIMNIMLVSVTERTREIGIRRAVGARKRGILMQFTMEAVVLCQVGGILGVLLGILGGNILALVMDVPPVIPFDWAAIGLVVCSAVGLVFGIYPAVKAAQLDPIEALRHE